MTGPRLLDWLNHPSPDRGIHFAEVDDGWTFWSYERLAGHVFGIAEGLRAANVEAGAVVTLAARSGPDFVGAFFGTLLVSATPSPIAPPSAFQDEAAYRNQVTRLLLAARPALVLADADLVEIVKDLAEPACVTFAAADLARDPAKGRFKDFAGDIKASAHPPRAEDDTPALLQFTSGSSGLARGVRIPHRSLEANLEAIQRRLQWTAEDCFVSWLPLHHDMGLIGGLISPIVFQSDLWLLQPEQFIRQPLRYLTCLAAPWMRLTVMPNFGLDYIVRRVQPTAVRDLDFSGLRGMVVGAERIEVRTLEAFNALLGPVGLRSNTILPAYGLAEATLAVTIVAPGDHWRGVRVDPASLMLGRPIKLRDDSADGDAISVIGCGRPLSDVSVSVVDESGTPVPEGHMGEIVVGGNSLAEGYVSDDGSTFPTDFAGQLETGDAGFLLEGELFVLGRLGDSLKVRGITVFSEDIESALGEIGVNRQRIAVLLGMHLGLPTAVLLVEEADPVYQAPAEALLRHHTGGARVFFVNAPRGAILRTSSGKPKRRTLWRAFTERDGLFEQPAIPNDG